MCQNQTSDFDTSDLSNQVVTNDDIEDLDLNEDLARTICSFAETFDDDVKQKDGMPQPFISTMAIEKTSRRILKARYTRSQAH